MEPRRLRTLVQTLAESAATLQAAGAIRPDHDGAWQAFRVQIEQLEAACLQEPTAPTGADLAQVTARVATLVAHVEETNARIDAAKAAPPAAPAPAADLAALGEKIDAVAGLVHALGVKADGLAV